MKLKNKIIDMIDNASECCVIDITARNVVRLEFEICSIDPLKWLSVQSDPVKLFWKERSDGSSIAAIGKCIDFTPRNSASLEDALVRCQAIVNNSDGVPRFYGGLCFGENKPCSDEWYNFCSFAFILPQIEIISRDGATFIVFNFQSELYETTDDLKKHLRSLIDRMNFNLDCSVNKSVIIDRIDLPPEQKWKTDVRHIIAEINKHNIDKVVL